MKVAKPKKDANTPHGLFFVVLLAVILAVLFGKSFLPGYVHFSNDGPLGQQNAEWIRLPAGFTGSWDDLNGIGANVGAFPLSLSTLIRWVFEPVAFAKFFPPIALFILGLGAWTFFRQLRLSPLAAVLGALAIALNSSFFACTCWGVAQEIAIGMDFFALALVVSNSSATPALIRWARLALAGLAVGMNVIEAADVGAILSVFVAAFVFYKAAADEGGSVVAKAGRGIGQVVMIAAFAGFIAMHSVISLVGSQISGIAGTGQDTESKAQHWNWATSWSEPKVETLGLFVPGLFGYRIDTPQGMMGFLQDSYKGGNYWGTVGSDPLLDPYFEGGRKGPTPPGQIRFTSGQNYVGVLVALVAAWTVAQSLRRRDSVFAKSQQRLIWFWTVASIGSLLLAYGRFAPFYKFFYLLPYASTIRIPTKFLIIFSCAIVTLFAYGIHALGRRFLEVPAANANSPLAQFKNWWMKARGFDRNWSLGCMVAVIGSFLAWLIYASEKPSLVRYLQTVGFDNEGLANQIATFSVGQVGWFVLFFTLAAGLCVLFIAGVFAGKRAKLGGLLLGLLLVIDLGRANLPYVIHWDYKQKYDLDSANPANSINPIINFLRDKPYEHRVIGLRFPPPQHLPFYDDLWGELYRIEWAQHHFPYYNIQSLDLIQRPRTPADEEAYEMALAPRSADMYARRWQLTNTRYLLGPAGFLDGLNEQLDPLQHRFRIVQRFDVLPKPGIQQLTSYEEITAVPGNDGACALFEFTGALPRAKLYSNWQISTNDSATLKTLASTNFDPLQRVLVSSPLPVAPVVNATNENSGTVEFKRYVPDDPVFSGKRNGLWKQSGYCYAPKDIMFDAKATTPSVLLLNDKFDPHWQVFVNGKPAELLRCNFIMRGVYLTPGAHTVEFKFTLPTGPLYVSLAAIVFGILLAGCLLVWQRRAASSRPNGT
jgi:hypothetical protein